MLTDRRRCFFILLGLFENDRVSKEERMKIKCFSAQSHLLDRFSCNDGFSLVESVLKLLHDSKSYVQFQPHKFHL